MLTLHPLLGDHAVLQCEKPLLVRGTAAPHAEVRVQFADCGAAGTAAADGTWSIELPALRPGGPHALEVSSGEERIRRRDLLLGEVWLCSGQSNMEWSLGMLAGTEPEIAAATDAELRCFTVGRTPGDAPATTLVGRWRPACPTDARDFSALAYFFARRLRAQLGRPVGVIVSAVGGSMIAAWLPRRVLEQRPEYAPLLSADAQASAAEALSFTPHAFTARAPATAGWEAPDCDDRDWAELPVPGCWQNAGWGHNGSVWYRRTIDLPPAWRGRELVLELMACDDFDDTYVNGRRVGGIGPEASNAYAMRRVYRLSPDLVAGPRLTLAVRVFDHWGNGGITGHVWLRPADDTEGGLPLDGTWRAKVEQSLPLRAPTSGVPAALLYNGMLHPLVGCGLRGVLWYQGESDVRRPALYRQLLPDLIATWRELWRDPQLPFGIVQLPNYEPPAADGNWAELREAQRLAAGALPGVGLTVALDLGEANNLHPRHKAPLAERLARWALATVYRQPDEPWSSPLPVEHWVDGAGISVRFSHVGQGLRARGALAGFEVAGADGRWCPAEATVVAPDVLRVRAGEVPAPMAVRYAWASNPAATLENSAGLPAAPYALRANGE